MRLALALLAAFMFVTACGKKAPLRPPGSERAPPSAPAGDDVTDGASNGRQTSGGTK